MIARRFAPIAVILVTPACSQEPQPSRSDIEQAVTASLPAFARISTLSVEATQNMGTNVEPLWHARFRATVKVASTTFARDGGDGGVTFVRVVKQDGESTEMFGKSASTLLAGKWRTSVEFEGQPIAGLGLPESAFGPGKVIVRGSKSEAAYIAEQAEKQRQETIAAQKAAEDQRVADARANEDRRKMLADASKTIVGTWRNQRGLIEIRADGGYHATLEDIDASETGTWSISADVFTIVWATAVLRGRPVRLSVKASASRIVRIDPSSYEMRGIASGAVYKASRIK